MEVQPTIEDLLSWFPPKGFTPPTGGLKDVKYKKVFKEMFKEYFPACRLKHKERASFLKGELANLVNLFRNLPGLLGPKFPVSNS